MKFARLSLISALLAFQSACLLPLGSFRDSQSTSSNRSQPKTVNREPKVGPEYDAYVNEVRKHFIESDYEWLEGEADRLGVSKERFPGGYWKLRVLYRTIEDLPANQTQDEFWKQHMSRIEGWTKQHPTSLMPRIILADAWLSYGWLARGTGYANTVTRQNHMVFKQRLEKANQVLTEASTLQEKSPEWYLTALLARRGQGDDREAFEALYEQAVALEPNYYYLQQAKAGYLLPRWYGQEGEWESFAESAADRVGGEQGDIILFSIYSNMMSYNNLEFMNTHRKIAPRLLAGFRAIEKLYGSSPQRLNEACLISFFADDDKTPVELMKRIGSDYDLSVWRDDSTFNIFRQEALKRSGQEPRYRQATDAPRERSLTP